MRVAYRRLVLIGILTLAGSVSAAALEIGSAAPDFRVSTIDGGYVSLSDAEKSHQAVVVMFLSTSCPYSNYYNDLIRDLAAEFGKKDVFFLGINSGRLETAEEAKSHAKEHGHAFPIAKDWDLHVADLLGARRTPEVFVIDHDGKLRYHGRVASKIASPDLKNALDALLAGHAVRPAETKAFGCAIPRS